MMEKPALRRVLQELYGINGCERILQALSFEPICRHAERGLWDETSMALITYGDSIREEGHLPLVSLTSFLQRELGGSLKWVHLLPFFPYTSDDGFSVSDYETVRPDLGTWQDIERLNDSFQLIFDAVINHTSVAHPWFHAWMAGDPAYSSFYLSLPKETDVSAVLRPRVHPLLTRFESSKGEQWVWTTFSEDQVDLDFSSPDVFVALAKLLRYYVEKGASGIRLDAIGHGWKDPKRSSLNLPEVHRWLVAMRLYLDLIESDVILLSETNVPQEENLLYFGKTEAEAHLIYNFALSGLVAHGFLRETASELGPYLQSLKVPRKDTAYFHVLATHDGIGVRPLIGILPEEEIQALADSALERGGSVNYKTNSDGSKSPYELNVTYYSMLKAPDEPEIWTAAKFRSAHMILLSLAGIPGLYYHSLFASENQLDERERTGMNRSINRKAIELPLSDRQEKALREMRQLLEMRMRQPAFHPSGNQRIAYDEHLLSIHRSSPDGKNQVTCVINMTHSDQSIPENLFGEDLWSGEIVKSLKPFEGRWLTNNQ